MKKEKKGWIGALLNFFLPGIGFTYIGTPLMIFGGILFFICDITISSLLDWGDIKTWLIAFFTNFSYAILGYGAVEIYNRTAE